MKKTILPFLLALGGLAAGPFAAADPREDYCYATYGNGACVDTSRGSSPSDEDRPVRQWTPEEIARTRDDVALGKVSHPEHCTPVAGGMQRCWKASFGLSTSAAKHLIVLYTLDASGKRQGNQLEYAGETGRLLWTAFYKDGEFGPKGSTSYNFYDAPAGQVYITKSNGTSFGTGKEQFANFYAPATQGVRELGLKSMNLRDTMHPEDYRQLLQAERHWRRIEAEYDRRWNRHPPLR